MTRLRLCLVNLGRRTRTYPLVTPPLGILYLAAYLREKFPLDIALINQREDNASLEAIVRRIVEFKPDIVGAGALTPGAYLMGPFSRLVRAALPDAAIVFGGPHASAAEAKAMEGTCANALVIGEGERTFELLIEAFSNQRGFEGVPGLIWRNREGEIVVNPGRTPFIEDLDSLPFPAYDLLDLSRYWRLQSMPPIPRRRYVSLLSSRGCPYGCSWCHNIFGRRFRAHSAERIVDEIAYYRTKFGVEDIEFLDDIFNLNAKRVHRFCEELRKRDLRVRIAFPAALRTDILTEDTVEALADAGTYFSAFALESGSPRIQEITGKHLDIPRFLRGVDMAVKRGIFSYGFNMLGFPTETEEEMEQTIDVACGSSLHSATFFTVTPFPNTRLYDEAMRADPERLANVRYEDFDFNSIRVNCSSVSDEVLFAYQRKAVRRFFLNPGRLYRLVRDFPQPHLLPLYIPILLSRMTKGSFPIRD